MSERETVELVMTLTKCGLEDACKKLVELGVFVKTEERGYIFAAKQPRIFTVAG